MDSKEYFKGLKDVTGGIIPLGDKASGHVLLYAPYLKKIKSFTLLMDGVHFFRLEPDTGALFYEVLEHGDLSDSKTLDESVIKSLEKLQGMNPKLKPDDVKEDFYEILDELKNYALGNHKKNNLHKIYAHTYCDTYRRPVKAVLSMDKDTTLEEYKKMLMLLRENAVCCISYPSDILYRTDYQNLLLLAKDFYKEISLTPSLVTPKVCTDFRTCGMDRIVLKVYSPDNETEFRHSGFQYKDILAAIKQALGHGISVTAETEIFTDNEDYVKVLSMLHPLGVKDFRISFDKSVKDKDLIVKRAYYYTNINELNLMLDTWNCLPEKLLKKMDVTPSFRELGRNPFILDKDGNLFSFRYRNKLGNLNNEPIMLIYDTKYLKVFRKGKFKEEDYETKNE